MPYYNYFITIIFPPSYSLTEIKKHMEKYIGFLKYTNSKCLENNFFGQRSLAYPIKNFLQGNLLILKISTLPASIKRIQDFLRQDETILRIEIAKIRNIEIKKDQAVAM